MVLAANKQLLIETDWPGGRKVLQFAASLSYYGLLCWVDRTVLAPVFDYQGLMYQSPSTWTQAGVVGLILLCTALTPVRYRQASDGVLYVLLFLVVIPVLTVAATDVLFSAIARNLIVSMVGAYLLLAICSLLPRPPGNPASWLSVRQPWLIVILLSVASYGLMFSTFGVHIRLLSFSNVDNVRAAFVEQAGGALNYLLNWQANVINPLFIVYGLRFRRALPLTAGLAGDLLIYTITGYKSVLFSALAVILFLLVLRQKSGAARPPATGVRFGFAFAALIAAAAALGRLTHSLTWTSLFVRRLSLVAGVNTGYYFQYFSTEPQAHLAYGVVGAILGTTGAVPPPKQIAIAFYHTATGEPNANMWADAYANFGHTGVVLFTLILAGFLWFYDRLAQNIDRRAATVLLIAPALNLANSALLTCLLTHGMLLALFVVAQWPRIVEQAERKGGPPAAYGPPARRGPGVLARAGRIISSGQGGVRKASFIVLIGGGLGLAISTLLTPFITRIFDPAVYGSFALITSITSIFVGISTFRLEVQAQKVLDDAVASTLIRLGFVASCVWGAALTMAAFAAVALWHVNAYWLSIGVLVTLASLQLLGTAVLTRERDYRSLAIANFIQGAGLGVIQLMLGLVSAGVGALLAGFGAARLCWIPSLRQPRYKRPRMATIWRENRRFAATAGSSAFINSLTTVLPVLLIAFFYGAAAAGELAIAIRILVAPLGVIGTAAGSANVGEVGHLLRSSDRTAVRVVRNGMRDLLAFGLIPCGLAAAVAVWAIPFILGGAWREAGQMLALLSAGALAQFVVAPFSLLLSMTGQNRSLLMWDTGRFCATVLSFFIPQQLGLSSVWAIGSYSVALVGVYCALAWVIIRSVAAYVAR